MHPARPGPYPTRPTARQARLPRSLRSLAIENHLPHQMPNQLQNQAIYATTDRTRAPRIRIPDRTIRPMSPSALRKTGSTRAWRRLRQPWSDHLAAGGTLQCAAHRTPKCLGLITQSADLALGHITDRSAGGNDRALQPECRPCSDHQGGQLTHAAQQAARQPPERKW